VIGTTLSHYRITARIGAGGMGEVYRATDMKLGRDVALKVLPREMASSPERLKRFRREARTVAALNHPHIVTIFSVEEDTGVHFLTMELVEGRGLDEILAADGGLARETFFEIAIPFADAVAAAHARGIVHRDLKPANLMLDAEGRLKVLDFGLAKIVPVASTTLDETQSQVTAFGQVIGTARYMSPEQASGRHVDERSDVFSLGTVLYELATGRRPFDGDSMPAILYAVVSHEPRPVSEARADLAGLDRVLAGCLVKSVEARRLTSAQVRDELRALRRESGGTDLPTAVEPAPVAAAEHGTSTSGGSSSRGARAMRSRRPVIAVLPFRSATADSEIEDFAASLGSDVVDGVTNTSQAVVLPGSATLRFRDQSADARRVGEELGAGYVVQGTVRRAGNRLRVTAQLVSVDTGTQIWSRHYERDLAQVDLFDVGDEIGTQIVSAVSDVHGVIFEVERQRVEGRAVADLDPWECIFVTLGYDKFIDVEHHRLAREALERAVELDPGFALAWGYISWIATDEVLYGFNPRPRSMQRAMAAARRAVELDPHSHMLRWLLARVLFFEGDVEGFLSEGNKALELNSNDATVIGLIGVYSSLSGHWQRGEELMRRAMALNPSYPSYYHMALGIDRFRQGRYEEALAEYRRLTFSNPFVQGFLAAILGHLGRAGDAAAALRQLQSQLPEPTPDAVRVMYERWNVRGELLEALMKGLDAAGLDGDA
jgi:serine/threonine protein kinase/cytochrome c-type biogenesis protein CcmH/NrfG